MQPEYLHMNPSGVHRIGDDTASIAAAAESSTRHALDASLAASTAHTGWGTSIAVQSCQQAWTNHLSTLARDTAATATKLHSTASAVEHADQEFADRLRTILEELSR